MRFLRFLARTLVLAGLCYGAWFSVDYYYRGIPKYAIGDCLFDESSFTLYKINGISNTDYMVSGVLLIFYFRGTAPIREFNALALKKIDCKTGEPIK
jgi:hypothetical protein